MHVGFDPRAQHHKPRAARRARILHPLQQQRMRQQRRHVGDQDQVGAVDILQRGGHHIFAIGGALHAAYHAAPGGMDVSRPQKALHQLVGDIIILGQQAAANMQRHAARPMTRLHGGQTPRDQRYGIVPCRALPLDLRVQQAPVQVRHGGQHVRTFAKTPDIGGMRLVALDPQVAIRAGHRPHAAPHATLAAQASDDRHLSSDSGCERS